MTKIHYGWLFSLLLFIALLCCSCSTTKSNTDDSVSVPPGYIPGQTNVLTPTADGTVQTGDDPLILDFSNASKGYFMGKVTSDDTKVNIQVSERTMWSITIFWKPKTTGRHSLSRPGTVPI